jgi:hypothetical protein
MRVIRRDPVVQPVASVEVDPLDARIVQEPCFLRRDVRVAGENGSRTLIPDCFLAVAELDPLAARRCAAGEAGGKNIVTVPDGSLPSPTRRRDGVLHEPKQAESASHETAGKAEGRNDEDHVIHRHGHVVKKSRQIRPRTSITMITSRNTP